LIKFIKKENITKVILLIATLLILISAIFIYTYINSTLSKELIRPNIYINNISIGSLTKIQAQEKLKEETNKKYRDLSLTISFEDYSNTFTLTKLSYACDAKEAINKAYLIGRKGTFNNKVKQYFLNKSPIYYSVSYIYDTNKIKEIVNKVSSELNKDKDASNISVLPDRIIAHVGQSSLKVNKEKLYDDIITHIKTLDSTNINIEVEREMPFKITSKRIYDLVYLPPINAQYSYENNKVKITKGRYGKTIDTKYIDELLTKYRDFTVDIENIKPQIVSSLLKEELFSDTLSTFRTTYPLDNDNDYNRSVNISLAANAINNYILPPGEVFSFNKIVGPRTKEKGYQLAHVYDGGKIVYGIGGGICQVSTTLYNASLYANFEIIERNAHQFTVDYAPLGQDSSVSYGYEDYVFKNNTSYPIKIVLEIKDVKTTNKEGQLIDGKTIECTFLGTKTNKDISYKYYYKILEERQYTTTIQYDSSKPNTYVSVLQEGRTGYIIRTIKETYINNEKIKEKTLGYSYYQPYPKVEIHGTIN